MIERVAFPEPSGDLDDTGALFVRYLAYYRDTVVSRVRGLSENEQRTSRLPSGWTPLELLSHLAHMERRWIVWGFLGRPVDRPWGDSDDETEGRWRIEDDETLDRLASRLAEVAGQTEAVLATTSLVDVAATGGRFHADPPTLVWICFHVLQEYARHAGHLDVAVEVAGGPTGE